MKAQLRRLIRTERAAACLQLAQEASDEQTRSLYLMMAEAWRQLAYKAENYDAAPGENGE